MEPEQKLQLMIESDPVKRMAAVVGFLSEEEG